MKKIYPVLSPSAKVDGQFVYRLPEQFGSGGACIDTFASGLQLSHINLQFKEKVSFIIEPSDGRIPIFTVMQLTMRYVNWPFVSDSSIVPIYSMSAA